MLVAVLVLPWCRSQSGGSKLHVLQVKFVEHAACNQARLIALIMPTVPSTKENDVRWPPDNYTLVEEDNELCSGGRFYMPGSKTSMRIDPKRQSPNFQIWKRDGAKLPTWKK